MPLRPSTPEALQRAIETDRAWRLRSAKKRAEKVARKGMKRRAGIKPRSKKKQKQLRAEEPKKAFIRSLPCLVCGSYGVDPHHEPLESQGGTSKDLTPLCRRHHTQGSDSRHELGSARLFLEVYGIDLIAEAARLDAEFRAREAA